MVVVLVTFGWQIAGLIAIQRGDFIDESKLRLRSAGVQEAGMGLEQVAALHLFGDVTANTVAPPPTTQDLPKTDLKLVLVGAMTDSDPQQASALIQADGQARRFYIGDSIPGGAVLRRLDRGLSQILPVQQQAGKTCHYVKGCNVTRDKISNKLKNNKTFECIKRFKNDNDGHEIF